MEREERGRKRERERSGIVKRRVLRFATQAVNGYRVQNSLGTVVIDGICRPTVGRQSDNSTM
jgi:hypothetical protein